MTRVCGILDLAILLFFYILEKNLLQTVIMFIDRGDKFHDIIGLDKSLDMGRGCYVGFNRW